VAFFIVTAMIASNLTQHEPVELRSEDVMGLL
jgi:hypothetical protein